MTQTGLPPAISVPRAIPALLSVVAGYVDSIIYLALFMLFVAQLTGSFVIAGVQVVSHDEGIVIKVAAIPVFVFAAILTALLATIAYRCGRFPLLYAFMLEGVLLAGMFAAALIGAPFQSPNAPLAIVASLCAIAAMGVQSAFVRLLMRGVASTNVMTTNTTVVAIDVTEMAITWFDRRRDKGDGKASAQFTAARDRFRALWPLGVGFFLGTLSGALAYRAVAVWALVGALAIMIGLVAWAWRQPAA